MKVYDLHTHVIPPNLIDVLLKTPERFGVRDATVHGVRVVERDGADRKSTRLNSSHSQQSRMPSSA